MHNFDIKYAFAINMEKSKLKKAIIDQKEELELLSSRTKIIERNCFEKYLAYTESTQVKVIMGIRRCGKSILSYQLLKGKQFAYINFDDENLAGLSAEDLNDVLEVFYEAYGDYKYILLDEIQNIAGWELFVNRLQRQGFNTIVTGRNIPLKLFPFSFREFVKYHGIAVKDADLLSTKERGLLEKKLEESVLFFLVPRYSYKAKQRAIATRKICAIDTGMISALSISFSRNIGKIYENMAFLELLRRIPQHEIYYWQDICKNEVDFVVKEGMLRN
jgi:predicted AAA+ superfamily ATPase